MLEAWVLKGWALAACLSLAATAATAQDSAAPPPDSDIEEIVVLGAESESSKDFEAADSVTGFGAEDLAALGAQDIADLAEFTPNLEIVTSGATTPTFFIRGVGLNDFNANSTGAVAIYQDDVPINAPALQLSTLYDIEAVNILRGPQGTGPARNASAGAIKIYSRKPTGEFGGFLRTEIGNFDFRDYEGAIEAPIFEDLLAGRFAFRFSERDGTMENRCGNARLPSTRVPIPRPAQQRAQGKKSTSPPWSICGEPVLQPPRGPFSDVPSGLESKVNNIHNWAARGTVLFQPTLDISLLLNAHGSRRDELTRLGQSIGTDGFVCQNNDTVNCPSRNGLLGGTQRVGLGYQPREIITRLRELAPCLTPMPGRPDGTCNTPQGRRRVNTAKNLLANELAQNLDSEPWKGDFNHTGPTTNDTWGVYVKGEVALPFGIELRTVTGYDTYERLIDIDLDFSPETVFHIKTQDEGWQVVQDLRLQGQIGETTPVRWDIGGWFLRETLDVVVDNDLGRVGNLAVGQRDYTQSLWSAAGFASLSIDFWEDFTLDGGFRWNWERKTLDYLLQFGTLDPLPANLDEVWDNPTGTIRLTYRFREDTQAFWKYTRGWKPGTYNATSAVVADFNTNVPFPNISVAEPETIDAFETGVRGSWFGGRFGLDFSLFYYLYENYQLFTSQQFAGGQPEFVILNSKSSEVFGAEIDAVIRPWIGAFVNVRGGWLESQFLDFVQIQQEIVNPGQRVINRELQNSGNRLLNSPQFKVSITAEQTLPLGRLGSLTARYDGVWTDVTYFDATEGRGIPNQQNIQFYPKEALAQPAFWLHNLRLSWRPSGGQMEIAAWVRNLENKPYKTFAFDGSTFNRTSIYFVGDPRTFGGTMIVNF